MISNSTFVIDKEGYVWGTGENNYGQLGLGDRNNRTKFEKVSNEKFKYVYNNQHNTVMIHEDGSLWGAGHNTYSELGLGSADIKSNLTMIHKGPFVHASIAFGFLVAVDTEGNLWGSGYKYSGISGEGVGQSTFINTLQKLTSISMKFKQAYVYGYDSSTLSIIAIGTDGHAYAWGYNDTNGYHAPFATTTSGYTINPQKCLENVKKIETSGSNNSYYQALALTEDGKVYAFGYYLNYQTGIGTVSPTKGFQKVPSLANETIIDISIGQYSSLAINDKGEMFSAGANSYGGLMNGSSTSSANTTFVKCPNITEKVTSIFSGMQQNFFINEKGELYATGTSAFIGINNSSSYLYNVPVKIDIDTDLSMRFSKVKMSMNYNRILLDEEGYLYGNGRNYNYELGDGSNLVVPSAKRITLEKFSDVSIGPIHSLAIHKEDKSLWACGYNRHYAFSEQKIGAYFGEFTKIMEGPIKKVFAASDGSFVLKEDGTLLYIGSNSYNEAGINSNSTISYYKRIGTEGEWADFISYTTYDTSFVFVGVKKDGSTWAWGVNNYQMISSSISNGANIPPTKISGETFITAYQGGNRIVLLKKDTSLWMMGAVGAGEIGSTVALNKKGVLTLVTDKMGWKKIALLGYSTIGLQEDGSVWASGTNSYNQFGDSYVNSTNTFIELYKPGFAKDISANSASITIVKSDGTLISSGGNDYNVLGYNSSMTNIPIHNTDNLLQYPLSLAGRLESSERVYDTKKAYSAILGGYVAYKLNALVPNDNVPENTGLRYAFSKDDTSWNVYRNGSWSTISASEMQSKGMTTEEVKALTNAELDQYSFSEIRVRLTMWTSDESKSPTFYNMSAYVDVAATKPVVSQTALNYSNTEMVYPKVSVSTDGTKFNEVEVDKVNSIIEENKGFQVKLDLEKDDEVDAISYSWN